MIAIGVTKMTKVPSDTKCKLHIRRKNQRRVRKKRGKCYCG